MNLEIGDIVQLKSGGARMVVSDVGADIHVFWMDSSGSLCNANLPIGILSRVNVASEELRDIIGRGPIMAR
jgi:hypothetical protein